MTHLPDTPHEPIYATYTVLSSIDTFDGAWRQAVVKAIKKLAEMDNAFRPGDVLKLSCDTRKQSGLLEVTARIDVIRADANAV